MKNSSNRLEQLFVGELQELQDDGSLTGLYKTPIDGAVQLQRDGLANDHQADRQNHGGPERALNHYPAEHYAHLASLFPRQAQAFIPGVLGENLSTRGMTESDVCIGDSYRLGQALIQVSQPRAPCWKISRRLGIVDLAKRVAKAGISGWLYRVLEPGAISVGEVLVLENRLPHRVTLSDLWSLKNSRQPSLALLKDYATLDGLAPAWRASFASRLKYLSKT